MNKREIVELLTGNKKYPGSAVKDGLAYHDIPLDIFKDVDSHRKGTSERVDHLISLYDFTGKTGIDIGCSVGGISFGIADRTDVELITGVDYDGTAIEVANRIQQYTNLPCKFYNMEVPSDQFWDLLVDIDFVIWLSSYMWINKAIGEKQALEMLSKVSDAVDTMFFESSENDGAAAQWSLGTTADEVQSQLEKHTSFTKVINTGTPVKGWNNRSVFLCTKNEV